MKLTSTCFLFLLLVSTGLFAQPRAGKKTATLPSKTGQTRIVKTQTADPHSIAVVSPITGVWRGFFTSGMGFFQEKYRYEVQIGQLNNNGIKGVTYSYKTTVFYGKANLAGMYTPSTKNLVLKENRLIEVKMSGGEACLMTCYLEYTRVGNTEVLEGTFTSVNVQTKTDCGSGRVYLEKVPESDFYKEDFIREYENRRNRPNVVTTPPRKPAPPPSTPQKKEEQRKPVKKDKVVENDPPKVNIPEPPEKIDEVIVKPIENPAKLSRELKERENRVAKVIEAEGDEITIELYDNGQIDNDTVTIFHNSQPVAVKKRLCHQPITLKIKVDPRHPRNEFVMVAENLGSIPPNTALMVVTVGRQRHEVFITSTEQKNAVVVVNCKIPSNELK
ncbi:MAG TPA: hypothetical protein VF145_04730 [Chitinophagaceae bacterium]